MYRDRCMEDLRILNDETMRSERLLQRNIQCLQERLKSIELVNTTTLVKMH
jgi:hypothetical protein